MVFARGSLASHRFLCLTGSCIVGRLRRRRLDALTIVRGLLPLPLPELRLFDRLSGTVARRGGSDDVVLLLHP